MGEVHQQTVTIITVPTWLSLRLQHRAPLDTNREELNTQHWLQYFFLQLHLKQIKIPQFYPQISLMKVTFKYNYKLPVRSLYLEMALNLFRVKSSLKMNEDCHGVYCRNEQEKKKAMWERNMPIGKVDKRFPILPAFYLMVYPPSSPLFHLLPVISSLHGASASVTATIKQGFLPHVITLSQPICQAFASAR